MSRGSPDSSLGCLVAIILLIPVGVYQVVKFIALGIAFLVSLASPGNRKKPIEIDLSEIDAMDGLSFEHFVADVLRSAGYQRVRVTKASGDFGVDIVATRNKEKWVFQCKCYHSRLGVKPIQEVYAGAVKYGAEHSVVVTNAYFTAHARELAVDLGVLLWDRDHLKIMIAEGGGLLTTIAPTREIPAEDESSIRPAEVSGPVEPDEDADTLYPVGFEPTELTEPEDVLEIVPVRDDEIIETKTGLEDRPMSVIIGAGKYVFGEDLPLGKYNLKVISGNGSLEIQTGFTEDGKPTHHWMSFGESKDNAASYSGLSLPAGWRFIVEGSVKAEITKSRMLVIE